MDSLNADRLDALPGPPTVFEAHDDIQLDEESVAWVKTRYREDSPEYQKKPRLQVGRPGGGSGEVVCGRPLVAEHSGVQADLELFVWVSGLYSARPPPSYDIVCQQPAYDGRASPGTGKIVRKVLL